MCWWINIRLMRPGADRGFVFQQYSLLPWKTTFQNIELGLKIRGMPKAERKELVNDYLNRVGLYKHRNAIRTSYRGGCSSGPVLFAPW
jgi:NitT/TauT family transport system ATP-binding protein